MQVSVVIPSYNHALFLDETIASVLQQVGDVATDLELVVVDDGSTDDSLEYLRSIEDPRLRLITQENRGAHAALNRGIEASRGELVFLLNSDDRFHAQRLARLAAHFAAHPEILLITTWIELIDGDGKTLGIKEAWHNMPPWPRPRSGPGLADGGDPALALLEANYVATTSNVAFRRSAWQQDGPGFAPLRYTHDWEFLLAAACRGTLAVLPEPLVSYRVHAKNTLAEGQAASSETEQSEPGRGTPGRGTPGRGEGVMRFEILWTVARHAHVLCQRRVDQPWDLDELTARVWRSLPRFGRDDLLATLLQLRGSSEAVPAEFDALLNTDHPWRQAAVQALSSESE